MKDGKWFLPGMAAMVVWLLVFPAAAYAGAGEAPGSEAALERENELESVETLENEPGSEAALENELEPGGWQQEDGIWYYVLPDGTKNREDLIWNETLYEFSYDGSLKSARWVPNTGGGAYPVFCYDEETQQLFDLLNEEKRDLFFEAHPDREEEYDGDEKNQYDRYAGFIMDEKLNQAAAHRMAAAQAQGYVQDRTQGRIPGEGTVNEYLASISYREHATCLELYIRGQDDAEEAFEKILEKTQERYDSTEKREYSLEYYRRIGIAHQETGQKQYFMIILMR